VAPAQTVVVRIGYQRTGAPFLLKTRAQNLEQKLTAAHASLEWVEFQSGPPILEAMRAGAVDVGYTGETPPVFGQSGGVPFVYVASDAPAPEAEAIVVPSGSKVQTVAELKGKRVALNRGSNVHYLLLRALESAGLTLNDIEFLPLPPPDARAVFDSGKLDAWVIWDPYLAAAELAGARVLKDGRDLVDNRFFYLARREFAEKHAEQLKIVMDAFGEVGSWSGEHREDSARLQSEATGVAYEALLKAERRHVYRVDPITPAVIAKQQAIGDAFHALGVIPTAVRAEQASLLAGAK
jgi:sulfonate transport system substrate-binding protein